MGIFLKECWNGGDCHVLWGRGLFDLCWFWCKEAHWRNWSCFCLLCLLSLAGWVVDWGEASALMAKNREPASVWTRGSMQEKQHNTWNSWEEEKETWSLSWWSGFNMRNRKFRRKSEGRERLKALKWISPKSWESRHYFWFLSFPLSLYSIHQQVELCLPPRYNLNLSASPQLHCFHPDPASTISAVLCST